MSTWQLGSRSKRLTAITTMVLALAYPAVKIDASGKSKKSQDSQSAATSQPQIDKSMPLQKALEMLETDLKQANRGDTFACVQRQPLQQITVSKDGFQYIDAGKNDRGFWKDDYSVTVSFRFKDMSYLKLAQPKNGQGFYVTNWPNPTLTPQPTRFIRQCVGGVSTQDIAGLVAAMNRLIWEASPQADESRRADERAFGQKAAEWRALTVKPAMPEEAHAHEVLAENAVQEKDAVKAIAEYTAALTIYPTWPEGQFNLALLCGNTGDYNAAVEHMQAYLELMPDAPDARAAKDKLIIWRDKLGKSPLGDQ
jgi:tetratricopeptide (TPR) repeat protein